MSTIFFYVSQSARSMLYFRSTRFLGNFAGANAAAAGTLKGLVSEVARVLKPGGTVLFVEKGESQELVRTNVCKARRLSRRNRRTTS